MLYTEKQKWLKERKSKEMGRNIGQDVFLSICIPTYNKGSRIAELIHYYLGQIPGEVELVAADDSSVDDTEALLNSIHDKRFYYYRNEKRLGYINMIHVLVGVENIAF